MDRPSGRRGRFVAALALLTAATLAPRLAAMGWAAEGGVDAVPDGPAGATPPPAPGTMSTPVRIFTDAQGRSCRVYAREVVIEGAHQMALATICREPSGRWVLSR